LVAKVKEVEVLAGGAQPMSYRASLTMFDPYIVYGLRTFMETCWLPALDNDGIEAMRQAMATVASPGCAIITHEFKGAASRVAPDATAFGLRRDHILVEILAAHLDSGDKFEEQRHRQWARDTRHAFDATALPGGYPNLLAESDAERAAKSYGGNAARLIAAKRRYDPDDVFRSAVPLPTSAAMADVA
jgi:berberine-like enzyme